MLTRRCENDFEDRDSDDNDRRVDFDELADNIGRVVTIFTRSGGCSGRGFTGLLVRVDRKFIKLITSFASAPRHPFGRDFDFNGFGFDGRFCDRSRFGTAIIIPIREIVAFVFNEV